MGGGLSLNDDKRLWTFFCWWSDLHFMVLFGIGCFQYAHTAMISFRSIIIIIFLLLLFEWHSSDFVANYVFYSFHFLYSFSSRMVFGSRENVKLLETQNKKIWLSELSFTNRISDPCGNRLATRLTKFLVIFHWHSFLHTE